MIVKNYREYIKENVSISDRKIKMIIQEISDSISDLFDEYRVDYTPQEAGWAEESLWDGPIIYGYKYAGSLSVGFEVNIYFHTKSWTGPFIEVDCSTNDVGVKFGFGEIDYLIEYIESELQKYEMRDNDRN